MPTPPSSPLALCACALLRSGRRSLACSREKREREREREHTRGRETQTERRPAAAKGCTQGLSIAELKEEREARLLLVKQKHISLWKCKEGWWPIAVVAIWLERHRHTHRDRERKRGTERHTDRVFFFGVGGWVGGCLCVVYGPYYKKGNLCEEQESMSGWSLWRAAFFCNNWVIRVYIREQEEEQEDGDFVLLLLSACMMGRQF
jgi:hypothetical protein